jgi:hypothetical protein
VRTFHSNGVIAYLDSDQFILNLLDFMPKGVDPTNPADTRPDVVTQADLLAAARIARLVTTFTMAANLNDFLNRMLPATRKARAAPAGTQGHSAVLLPPGAALKPRNRRGRRILDATTAGLIGVIALLRLLLVGVWSRSRSGDGDE